MRSEEPTQPHQRLDAELTLLWRRLRWMSVTLARKVDDGLEAPAYGLLGAVHDAGSGVRGGDLAERFGLDKSTVSRQIAQLESLGLVERVTDPDDKRARLIHITDAGRDMVFRLRVARGEWLRTALQPWAESDVERLVALVGKLNESVGTVLGKGQDHPV
ncbi:MarR family transcriptional regulator [Phytoactinopolyspora alkaliphila]|uniref:MarR family transcriptional regulator n=1 Tax=Phytoactinopolyspora alkaliphila TaxID=1783498 RepID=A0A6N9YU95_9ACTN|nr:MarR family transcriptional regulator [Phytoactinopolyspora alkaliphila]NED98510.1 MarR family transcriptional regulator [Phytoactinopolyspora alkaliphila]